MDVARPYTAVCPSLDGEVLRVLSGTASALTGREVARLTGRSSHSGVLSVLNRLTEHGLVTRVELNSAALFSLNREHIAYPAVAALAGLRAALLDFIREAVRMWDVQPIHLSMFGSAARGDGNTRSDIDLLVVRPEEVEEEDPRWREQFETLREAIERKTGNVVSMLEISEPELDRLRDEEPPIVEALRAEAITLSGPRASELLR
jgi:predicted nucleotidyltransferase